MKHFCLNCGRELKESQFLCPSCHHNVYLDSIDDKMVAASAGILSSTNIELNTQWAKYKCGVNGSTGHGFAAEDYNSFIDKINGHSVTDVGRANESDGADRIVDNVHVQVKYCATPRATVNAAFDANGAGEYRYYADNSPQILEVPSDQYEDCLRIMDEKIKNGQIKNIGTRTAKDIVRKGRCSYPQARNIAKAGNIDSLIFDVRTGSVVALTSMGVSFCVKLGIAAISCRSAEDLKMAVQLSFLDGLAAGTITLSTSIFTSQILRTGFGRNFVALMQHASKDSIDTLYQTSIGKKLIHDIASGMWAKSLAGISAKNTVVKLVRISAIGNTSVFLITSIPDTYRFVVQKSISTPQFIKNLVVNATSITGATIGYILGLKLGKPGAVIGGMVGGAIGGLLTKSIAQRITKDDAERMHELIKIALLELSNEYCIQTQEEFDRAVRNIHFDKVIDTNLLRAMYSIGRDGDRDDIRVEYAKMILDYQFEVVARQRRQFKMLDNEQFLIGAIDSININ